MDRIHQCAVRGRSGGGMRGHMPITASAPGKLMLLGDHAVVYRYPCLVTAVDLRVRVSVEKIDQPEILIETPVLREQKKIYSLALNDLMSLVDYDKQTAFVTAAVQQVFTKFNLKQGLKISTGGPPNSFGLGSSSAATVATVFALGHLFSLQLGKRQIFDLAYSAVLAVQKIGSGFDIASAVYGGTLYYKLGETIDPLPVSSFPILIGYSGEKVSTTNLVQAVSKLRERNKSMVDGIFRIIGEIVEQARIHLEKENWAAFGELMNIDQGLLEALGVSTFSLEKPIYAAREHGAYGAKLSGAGGGDCMFALVDRERRQAVKKAMIFAGTEIVPWATNAEGVRLE
jgi:mevalonate kinase